MVEQDIEKAVETSVIGPEAKTVLRRQRGQSPVRMTPEFSLGSGSWRLEDYGGGETAASEENSSNQNAETCLDPD